MRISSWSWWTTDHFERGGSRAMMRAGLHGCSRINMLQIAARGARKPSQWCFVWRAVSEHFSHCVALFCSGVPPYLKFCTERMVLPMSFWEVFVLFLRCFSFSDAIPERVGSRIPHVVTSCSVHSFFSFPPCRSHSKRQEDIELH